MKVPKKIMEAMTAYINNSLLPICYELQHSFDPDLSYEDYCKMVLDSLEEGGKEKCKSS